MILDNVMLKAIASVSVVLALSACTSLDRFVKEGQDSGSYSVQEVGRLSAVTEGVILAIKPIKLSGSKGLGATLGTALGGLAGASTTDKKYNQEAAVAIGALAGALLGSTVEEFGTEKTGYEFLIETNSGVSAFVDATKQDLQVGDVVHIIQGSGPIRISKK